MYNGTVVVVNIRRHPPNQVDNVGKQYKDPFFVFLSGAKNQGLTQYTRMI